MSIYPSDVPPAVCHVSLPELTEQLCAAAHDDPLQHDVVPDYKRDDVDVVLLLGAVDAEICRVVPVGLVGNAVNAVRAGMR